MPTGLSAATTIGRHVSVGSGSLLRSTTIQAESVLGLRVICMEGSVARAPAPRHRPPAPGSARAPDPNPQSAASPTTSTPRNPAPWAAPPPQVESHAVLAAGSVVPPARYIPSGQLWAGNPAKFVRHLTADELAELPKIAERIRLEAGDHAGQLLPYTAAYGELEELRAFLSRGRA